MRIEKTFVAYLILFFTFPIVLKGLGFIHLDWLSIFAFLFLFIGLVFVYTNFGTKNSSLILIGSSIFLAGIFIFLFDNFHFSNRFNLLLPSVIYIISFGLLIVYLNDRRQKLHLINALVLFVFTTIYISVIGRFSLSTFGNAIVMILESFWLIIFLAFFSLLFLFAKDLFRKKENEKIKKETDEPPFSNTENENSDLGSR
ncbi:MAG: hypothetical protein C0425_05705 [Chlorobiaceae bacterium]|nr:hypothetical protein [Chlorobiaceae bacterium]MBA4309813.1 hypothetical protein [Chlorobiaceae bacterium]